MSRNHYDRHYHHPPPHSDNHNHPVWWCSHWPGWQPLAALGSLFAGIFNVFFLNNLAILFHCNGTKSEFHQVEDMTLVVW